MKMFLNSLKCLFIKGDIAILFIGNFWIRYKNYN